MLMDLICPRDLVHYIMFFFLVILLLLKGRIRLLRIATARYTNKIVCIYLYIVASNRNAFSNDINQCLFSGWKQVGIITGNVPCSGKGLCYGTNPNAQAQFAVCYNTNTLTPDFTGHVVESQSGSGRSSSFKSDTGPFGKNLLNQPFE